VRVRARAVGLALGLVLAPVAARAESAAADPRAETPAANSGAALAEARAETPAAASGAQTPLADSHAEAPGADSGGETPAAPPPGREDATPPGPSVDERLEEIRRRIQEAVAYPPIARRLALEATTWLGFEIDRRGVAHAVEVSRSSGHAVLDDAARRTLDRAGPLPWVYGRVEVPVRFELDDPAP